MSARPLPSTYWVLWTGTLVNRLGAFVLPFLAFYLTRARGLSATQAGVVVSLYGAGALAAGFVGGELADRVGRRKTLLLSLFGGAVTMLALAAVREPLAIAGVTLLLGLTYELYRPAVQAAVADLVPDADRVRAYALLHWAVNVGFSIAPVAAGLVATQASYTWLFVIDAVTTAAYGVIVLARVPDTRPVVAAGSPGLPPGPGPWRDHTFVAACVLNSLVAGVFIQAMSSLPIDMGQLGHSPRTFGLTIACNGVLIVLLQPFVPRWSSGWKPWRALAGAAVLIGVGFGVYAASTEVTWFVVGVVLWTLGEIIALPVAGALVSRLAPIGRQGAYQGLYAAANGMAYLAGPGLGGWMLQRGGREALWFGCLLVGLVAAAGFLMLGPRLARRLQMRG